MKKVLMLLVLFLSFSLTACTIKLGEEETKEKPLEEESPSSEEQKEPEEKENTENVGKKSSKDNPLSVGTVGLSSKHNALLDTYQDVDISIKEVSKDPIKIIGEYNTDNPDKMLVATKGYKFVVLDYEVTLNNFETESFGTDVRVDVDITDTSDKPFVVGGVKQIVDVHILKEDVGVVSGNKGTVQIAFEIPEDVSNYLIKLGTKGHTIAYYKL